MNVISSQYLTAERRHGVCRGTLWRQCATTHSPSSSGMLGLSAAMSSSSTMGSPSGGPLTSAALGGERVCEYCILVANRLDCYESAASASRGEWPTMTFLVVGASSSATDANEISFRLVTNQGTHLHCQATSKRCRDVWLGAFLAGLELSLEQAAVIPTVPSSGQLSPTHQPSQWTGRNRSPAVSTLFTSAGFSANLTPPAPPKQKRLLLLARTRYCVSCGVVEDTRINNITVQASPVPHYGFESRQDLCEDCLVAQGLLAHVDYHLMALGAAQQERAAIDQAAAALCTEQHHHQQPQPQQCNHRSSSTSENPDSTQPPPPQQQQQPSSSSVLVQDNDPTRFAAWRRLSPALETLYEQYQQGLMGWIDFHEQLMEMAMKQQETSLAELKSQAFRVAGDMGSAMQLLLETALHGKRSISEFRCLLDFLLDLCDEGEIATVAFYWPQLCHIHLRMLPPTDASQVARVEMVEDFLLTVACQHSIQLALELVWSHTADLDESFNPNCSPHCKRRRYAIIRFICELESLLFDFEGGWGGGSVSLGRMLSPTAHQVDILKDRMRQIQNHRLRYSTTSSTQRSARLSALRANIRQLSPDQAAKEKLRIAKNADYFSCHLNFTRRLSDIAEKLRFMDISERTAALQDELELLNSSGTMGGDPLNRVQRDAVRVVRIPSTEGHVFRSKERTPVLLLMEVIREGNDFSEDAPSEKQQQQQQQHGERIQTGSESSVDRSDSWEEKRHAGALRRFTENGSPEPLTPRRDVEQMVNSAATQQLQDLSLPDLRIASNGGGSATLLPTRLVVDDAEPMKQLAALGDRAMDSMQGDDDDGNKEIKDSRTDQNCVTFALSKIDDIAMVQATTRPELSNDLVDINTPTPAVTGDKKPNPNQECTSPVQIQFEGRAEISTSKDYPRSSNKKLPSMGTLKATRSSGDPSKNTLAPTGDVRREVLTAIMMRGLQGNVIAAGAAVSVQRSLQELERKRATELLLQDDGEAANESNGLCEGKSESGRDVLVSLALAIQNEELIVQQTEEDEVMEAIRLLLIQNRVAQGILSPADAAKVLQHTSLNSRASSNDLLQSHGHSDGMKDHDLATVDAGDVDRRLVGCGPVPPAVLQALTLWKAGLVTHAELLELVKKDAVFVRHSVLLDAENVDKLNEDSVFWGRFSFGERWAEKKARIAASSPQGSTAGWDLMGVIVKSNDDLRQEAFVMQLIELCQEAFDLAGLELWVNPYRILATGRTTGVIEMVRNAMSFDALKKRPGYGKGGLREHLLRMTEFTADPGESFKSAQRNFVRSLAAYSLMSYLFLFKDRHNGNILLDTAGHVIHIDFGFVFGIAPGGSFSLEMSTPFKLTDEMLDVMGGLRSPLFSEFVTLFCCGFLALQSHCDTFLTLVEITCQDSTFKCFDGKDTKDMMSRFQERFCPELSKEDTVSFALDLIKQATTSYGTRQYDLFQYMSQGIAT